jgi:hypothetical protein
MWKTLLPGGPICQGVTDSHARRKRLTDWRPHLSESAWEELVLAIRNHLERRLPLRVEVVMRTKHDEKETWLIEGLVERNAGGQPMYLAGTVQVIAPKHRAELPGS